MGQYTMWIVLGVLIMVVIGFLIASAILDKKKRKKQIILEFRDKKNQEMAAGKIAILVNLLVYFNNKKLKEFIPSVGNYKMSDINNLAKKELERIKKDKIYKVILGNEDVIKHFLIFSRTKSNNWAKQIKSTIDFFEKYEKGLDNNLPKFKEFKLKSKARLTKEYK